jgi:hypothetical protein
VFEPALPGRSSPASASPPATSGRSRKHNNGWNPKGLLPGRRRVLLLAVRHGNGGVEVQPQLTGQVRSGAGRPRPRPARASARAARTQSDGVGVTPVQHPPGGRHRRHRPEQALPIYLHRLDRVWVPVLVYLLDQSTARRPPAPWWSSVSPPWAGRSARTAQGTCSWAGAWSSVSWRSEAPRPERRPRPRTPRRGAARLVRGAEAGRRRADGDPPAPARPPGPPLRL